MDIASIRRALIGELRLVGPTGSAGFDGATGDRFYFDEFQDGPASYSVVNLVNGYFVTVGGFDRNLGIVLTRPVSLALAAFPSTPTSTSGGNLVRW